MSGRAQILPESGPQAPPSSNGELVFEAPWQSRVFGITLSLLEAGSFDWPEFQSRLITAIARHEAERGEGEYRYYDCWLDALCDLATDKGWLDGAGLDALVRELDARPLGHDHPHPHDDEPLR